MTPLSELYQRLSHDSRLVKNPLSIDLLEANAVLHNEAATAEELHECLALWCKGQDADKNPHQPCQFGRIAAAGGRIHFCVLQHEALTTWPDDDIAAFIADEKQLWKQRALQGKNNPPHSFVLVAASVDLANAFPDKHLMAFSDRLLQLTGWAPERRVKYQNTLTSDYLYLEHPNDGDLYGFQFFADFFACAGDRRWWHDHRFPGGIAFTANSAGHMVRYRDWYQGDSGADTWGLTQAMLTIENAKPMGNPEADTPLERGLATWLLPLTEGKPYDARVTCPENLKPRLKEWDWTYYSGVLHTDHAVRREFFQDRPTPPTKSSPHLLDLIYLYYKAGEAYVDFTGGKPFTHDEVYAELGRPGEWTRRTTRGPRERTEEETALLAQQLDVCRRWETAPVDE